MMSNVGRRGPAGKPTALRVLHGDRPARINRQEPRPPPLGMERPAWLSIGAEAEWDHLAPHLGLMGTVKGTDEVMLAALCETITRWKRVIALAAKTPPVRNVAEEGEPPVFVKNPLYSQARDLTNELRVLCREFGLTPSARAGLRIEIVTSGLTPDRLFTRGS
jgi:P27 family predicted phage terminase small subunit